MKMTYSKKNVVFTKKDQTNKIGLGISIAILAMVVLGLIAVFCDTHTYGFQYTPHNTLIPVDMSDPIYGWLDARLLAYFHFAFNIFAGIVAIANIVEFSLIYRNKLNKTHAWLHVLNLACATSLAFNLLFTVVYLIPLCCTTNGYLYEYLFTGSNLIFNLAVPVLGTFLYIFCFKGYSLKNRWLSLVGGIPVVIYFVIYISVILANANSDVTVKSWDIYDFGVLNKYYTIIALTVAILVTGGICMGLYQLNKIGKINRWMIITAVNIFITVTILSSTVLMFKTNITHDCFEEGLTQVQTFFLRFVFFTHLSNWWVGATCVIYSIYAIKIYKGKQKQIPIWAQIMRLAGIAAISITLIMQFVVSASFMMDSSIADWHERLTRAYIKCFRKHLLFEHFVIPFVVIFSYLVLEHSNLKWRHMLHSASPLGVYAVVYAIVLYCNVDKTLRGDIIGQEGFVSPWDVYEISKIFGSWGKYIYWILPAIVYGLMLILNSLFYLINRKIHFDLPKKGPAFAELRKRK